jgi:hypothetical protein
VFPPEYEAVRAAGVVVAGTPDQASAEIARHMRQSGANYPSRRAAARGRDCIPLPRYLFEIVGLSE